jgi:hydrogenase large subunit
MGTRVVKETNPSVLAKAEKILVPHLALHGHRTVFDIMRAQLSVGDQT